ncbi:ferredoxin [Actinomadura logoneensis]|uniref:Ferredoxin n=1 Tax=Actinomadura logoneensis TaxID=2293572 RepID=A0A372JU16_9ACTN|nr:ferredoxin [Actinomadura logoneensis]RFU42848.1 ferredoxin [Actinomadura logoneensis]
MRVTVDPLVCEANAVCVGIAEEVFDLTDDDELVILREEVPPELADKVRHAVRSCPKAALSLEE